MPTGPWDAAVQFLEQRVPFDAPGLLPVCELVHTALLARLQDANGVGVDPETIAAWYLVSAQFFCLRAQWGQAAAEFEQAVGLATEPDQQRMAAVAWLCRYAKSLAKPHPQDALSAFRLALDVSSEEQAHFLVDRSWEVAAQFRMADKPIDAIEVLESAAEKLVAAKGPDPHGYQPCRRLVNSYRRLYPLYEFVGRSKDATEARTRMIDLLERIVNRFSMQAGGDLSIFRSWLITAYVESERHADVLRIKNERLAENPDSATAQNDLAWFLATAPDESLRDPGAAVELARRAVASSPDN